MSASYNRVILIGNVCRDPELRNTPGGTAVTDVSLAVNDRRKNAQGEWIEDVTFVDCTLWGRTAEIGCEYLRKGSPAMIEGRLKLDTWQTDGQKRSKLKVIGERLQLLGAKSGEQRAGREEPRPENAEPDQSQPTGLPPTEEDDIPF